MHRASALHGIVLATLVGTALPASAGKGCDAPPETWQSGGAVRALAERQGWRVERLKIDDGCYEVKGRDADGHRLKAKLDPATLKVISIKREHGHRERERRREGAAAGPSNPSQELRP